MTRSSLPRLVISTGEPAGIGPDLCAQITGDTFAADLVFVGDPQVLASRAEALGIDLEVETVSALEKIETTQHRPGILKVLPVKTETPVTAGTLDPENAASVLDIIRECVSACSDGHAQAMVTAPLHKGVINDAGVAFTGHTEFLAELTGAKQPVMLLCAGTLRVALVTTHLPLRNVADAINGDTIVSVLRALYTGLQSRFGIQEPRISVCGLNPHAGEGGHLGSEEIEVITPTLEQLRSDTGWTLHGPLPADTAFTPGHLKECDAVLAMYHDQGLPVLKYAGFGNAVNVTLGLPIIRTSVDHGTALDLAGKGGADAGSLKAAIELAISAAKIS